MREEDINILLSLMSAIEGVQSVARQLQLTSVERHCVTAMQDLPEPPPCFTTAVKTRNKLLGVQRAKSVRSPKPRITPHMSIYEHKDRTDGVKKCQSEQSVPNPTAADEDSDQFSEATPRLVRKNVVMRRSTNASESSSKAARIVSRNAVREKKLTIAEQQLGAAGSASSQDDERSTSPSLLIGKSSSSGIGRKISFSKTGRSNLKKSKELHTFEENPLDEDRERLMRDRRQSEPFSSLHVGLSGSTGKLHIDRTTMRTCSIDSHHVGSNLCRSVGSSFLSEVGLDEEDEDFESGGLRKSASVQQIEPKPQHGGGFSKLRRTSTMNEGDPHTKESRGGSILSSHSHGDSDGDRYESDRVRSSGPNTSMRTKGSSTWKTLLKMTKSRGDSIKYQ